MNSLLHSTKQALRENNIKPNKSLGQNFLIDESVCKEIVRRADIQSNDTVVEVGAGFGALTHYIAEKARRVIAFEKDAVIATVLQQSVSASGNIEVVNQDILKFQPAQHGLRDAPYKIVGAPPYYLTARLFRTTLQDIEQQPSSITLLIQREVAEKIASKPPRCSLLGSSVQAYGTAQLFTTVPQNSFLPQPPVESRIITVRDIHKLGLDERVFFKIVRAGFSSPRKQILKNLSDGLGEDRQVLRSMMLDLEIDPTSRAETLSIDDWMRLTEHIITL